MIPLAAVIDWDGILDVVLASLVAGVGVTAVFAVAIFGATRVSETSRDRRTVQAGAYGALTMLALSAVMAAVVFGIVVMATD